MTIYKHSLSIALFLLFIVSFVLHFYGSLKHTNEELSRLHKPLVSGTDYLTDPELKESSAKRSHAAVRHTCPNCSQGGLSEPYKVAGRILEAAASANEGLGGEYEVRS